MIDQVRKHFDSIADNYDSYKRKNGYYHDQVTRFYCQIIPPDSRVLEVGCATGSLLAAVKPLYGFGMDISGNMIEAAKKKHPDLDLVKGDIWTLEPRQDFDYIILSNLLDYTEDLCLFFGRLREWAGDDTKILINNINPLWAPVIRLGAKLGLRTPDAPRNFVTLRDICNILEVADYDISEKGFRLALPVRIPLISKIINKIIPRVFVINNISFVQYAVCRKRQRLSKRDKLSCSVIVPCHNEEGNVEECVRRVPRVGAQTEILIVDDGSTDRTYDIARKMAKEIEGVRVVRIEKNLGKGNAVRTGFESAKGDVLMILDADMAVMPEDIPKFFNAIADGTAEFVNGTRMVYPMEKEAMKFANYIGNKMFGIMMSIIMGQRNTDTLCGTKALLKRHYRHIEMKDCKWGDFDLLYGAAKLRLKMAEMPVHYKKRISGKSKMKAFRHGLGMMQKCLSMLWELE
ncbi:MAG: glycosyltransferase [Candidatus Omnitrophica bacterium]|nr:glycosyltransferase [Candidatus Omnitrophota bacterium]